MTSRMKTLLIVGLLACLLLSSAAAAPAPPTIERWVTGGGGGGAITGVFTLEATIGQPLAGYGGEQLCSGFWCGAPGMSRLVLPVVLRNLTSRR
jgi:hypothetical protein